MVDLQVIANNVIAGKANETKALVELDGGMPGEDRDLVLRDPAAHLRQGELFPLLGDRRHRDLLLAQYGDHGVLVLGDENSLLRLSGARAAFPRVVRHLSSSSGPGGRYRRSVDRREPAAAATGEAPGTVLIPAPRLIMSCNSSG